MCVSRLGKLLFGRSLFTIFCSSRTWNFKSLYHHLSFLYNKRSIFQISTLSKSYQQCQQHSCNVSGMCLPSRTNMGSFNAAIFRKKINAAKSKTLNTRQEFHSVYLVCKVQQQTKTLQHRQTSTSVSIKPISLSEYQLHGKYTVYSCDLSLDHHHPDQSCTGALSTARFPGERLAPLDLQHIITNKNPHEYTKHAFSNKFSTSNAPVSNSREFSNWKTTSNHNSASGSTPKIA